jgi:C4-type Zn-finger protein
MIIMEQKVEEAKKEEAKKPQLICGICGGEMEGWGYELNHPLIKKIIPAKYTNMELWVCKNCGFASIFFKSPQEKKSQEKQ